MLWGFLGNLIFAISARILCGNYLKTVLSDNYLSLCSSFNLYFSNSEFLIFWSLSNVIGSMTNEEMSRTLLMATYVIPNVDSFLPILTQALFKVIPWLLRTVNAQASVKGSCCLSCTTLPHWTVAVIGGIGTHEGLLSVKDGPENESNFTITATGNDGGCVLGS